MECTFRFFFRQEARSIIKRSVNASDNDLILFVGSGTTGAVNKLVEILKRSKWGSLSSYYQQNRWGSVDCKLCSMSFSSQGKYIKHLNSTVHTNNLPVEATVLSDENPVIFTSLFEHHSNYLP